MTSDHGVVGQRRKRRQLDSLTPQAEGSRTGGLGAKGRTGMEMAGEEEGKEGGMRDEMKGSGGGVWRAGG